MHVRALIIASAALAGGTNVAAAPGQPPRETPQTESNAPRVLLASADEARLPPQAGQQSAAASKRPRVARVTTCRCGNPQAQADQEQ